MVFCNKEKKQLDNIRKNCHNPYFNRWFSAIIYTTEIHQTLKVVTILILIDGFLQFGLYVDFKST